MAGPPMTAMPGPPLRQYRPPQHNNTSQVARQNRLPRPPMVPQIINGPTVTVFVGNITEKAPDQMIRHILAACGTVVSWKRVQGEFLEFLSFMWPYAKFQLASFISETQC